MTINEKKDYRFLKTKKKIITAMINLLQKESFDEITVKNICEEAKISRSAFYLHYEDKYNLVMQYQNEFILTINNELFTDKELIPEEIMLSVLQKLKSEGKLLAMLLSNRGSMEIQNQIKQLIKKNMSERVLDHIKNTDLTSQRDKDYLLDYLSGAHLGFIQAWINGGQKESPEELAQIIGKINKFQL